MKEFSLKQIGVIRSEIKERKDAPLSCLNGGPDAEVEIFPEYIDGLHQIKPGDNIIIVTWLHQADRSTLKVHPKGDESRPLRGVFLVRSPDRPNPIGLHRVNVLQILPDGLRIAPIEAIDGTPVIDIKGVFDSIDY